MGAHLMGANGHGLRELLRERESFFQRRKCDFVKIGA
jgi:hypothetical protein